jgi:hypothetical protein
MTVSQLVLQPDASGWLVITNGRHMRTGELRGCTDDEAIFNDPGQIKAEYLAASVAAAKEIYQQRLRPVMGTPRARLRNQPQLVEASVPNGGTYANGLHYPQVPLRPTTQSQQWGQLWADQGCQGVGTTLPVASPAGTRNLWTCVFLQPQTVVTVLTTWCAI